MSHQIVRFLSFVRRLLPAAGNVLEQVISTYFNGIKPSILLVYSSIPSEFELSDGRLFIDAVHQDFQLFREKGISHPYMDRIELLFKTNGTQ